jgi:hypothetical protein
MMKGLSMEFFQLQTCALPSLANLAGKVSSACGFSDALGGALPSSGLLLLLEHHTER